ncbi:MAG: hypothetical protein WBZ42_08145 [Halobacteriota archaeon]
MDVFCHSGDLVVKMPTPLDVFLSIPVYITGGFISTVDCDEGRISKQQLVSMIDTSVPKRLREDNRGRKRS